MKTKHTLGPWKIDKNEQLPLAVITDDENGYGICEIEGNRSEENLANAKLIAAAPELLDALIDVVRILEINSTYDNLYQRNKINHLIKKATNR